ncbi:MAG: hypothetical protein WDW36_002204 [Sanguina aurantia]
MLPAGYCSSRRVYPIATTATQAAATPMYARYSTCANRAVAVADPAPTDNAAPRALSVTVPSNLPEVSDWVASRPAFSSTRCAKRGGSSLLIRLIAAPSRTTEPPCTISTVRP